MRGEHGFDVVQCGAVGMGFVIPTLHFTNTTTPCFMLILLPASISYDGSDGQNNPSDELDAAVAAMVNCAL
jgi:hypothetical protein